jgi:hypothetical protein
MAEGEKDVTIGQERIAEVAPAEVLPGINEGEPKKRLLACFESAASILADYKKIRDIDYYRQPEDVVNHDRLSPFEIDTLRGEIIKAASQRRERLDVHLRHLEESKSGEGSLGTSEEALAHVASIIEEVSTEVIALYDLRQRSRALNEVYAQAVLNEAGFESPEDANEAGTSLDAEARAIASRKSLLLKGSLKERVANAFGVSKNANDLEKGFDFSRDLAKEAREIVASSKIGISVPIFSYDESSQLQSFIGGMLKETLNECIRTYKEERDVHVAQLEVPEIDSITIGQLNDEALLLSFKDELAKLPEDLKQEVFQANRKARSIRLEIGYRTSPTEEEMQKDLEDWKILKEWNEYFEDLHVRLHNYQVAIYYGTAFPQKETRPYNEKWNEALQDLTHVFNHEKELSQAVSSHEVYEMRQAYNSTGIGEIDELRALFIYGKEQERGFAAEKMEFINKKTVDVWTALKDSGRATSIIGAETANEFDRLLSTATVECLTGTSSYSSISDVGGAGLSLLRFRSSECVAINVLNAWRDGTDNFRFVNGGYPGKDTLLFKYLSGLDEEGLSNVRALGIPGIMEVIQCVRNSSDTFNKVNIYDENGKWHKNPAYAEIQENLLTAATYCLQNSADIVPEGFVLDLCGHIDGDISQVYGILKSQGKLHTREAKKLYINRIRNKDDVAAVALFLDGIEENQGDLSQLLVTLESAARIVAYKSPESDLALRICGIVDSLLQSGAINNAFGVGQVIAIYDMLNRSSPTLQEFLLSPEYSDYFNQAIDSSSSTMLPFIIRQRAHHGNEQLFSYFKRNLCKGKNYSRRQEVSRQFATTLRGMEETASVFGQSGRAYEQTVEEIISWLDDENVNLQRQGASILRHLLTDAPKDQMDGIEEGKEERKSSIKRKLDEGLLKQLLNHPDVVVRASAFTLVSKLDYSIFDDESVDVKELRAEILSTYTNDDDKEWFEELALFHKSEENARYEIEDLPLNYTKSQAARIAEGILSNGYYAAAGRFGLLRGLQGANLITDKNQVEAITALQIYDLKTPQDAAYIQDENEVNENNWFQLLTAYIALEGDDGINASAELRSKVSNFFKDDEAKGLALQKVQEIWKYFLKSNQAGAAHIKASIIGAAVNRAGGAGNLKYVEALGDLIGQLRMVSNSRTSAGRTKDEVYSGLEKQEERFKKEGWSEDDKALFYGISSDILAASPSLYADIFPLVEQCKPKELKAFMTDIFPLYQAQLVILQRQMNDGIEYDARELVAVRRGMESFLSSLAEPEKNKDEAFLEEKERLVGVLHTGFKQRFGLLKVPEILDAEKIRSIQNITRYLGNINDKDLQKERLLSFYLGLMLNGEWNTFRAGEAIDVASYFEGDNLAFINNYLEDRTECEVITEESTGLSAEKVSEFKAQLQRTTLNRLEGSTETIDNKLNSIISNFEELLDEDAYTDEIDKTLLSAYKAYGKDVSSVLSKLFQNASGKDISFSSGEDQAKSLIEERLHVRGWTPELVKELQSQSSTTNLIVKLNGLVKSEGWRSEIEELRKRLRPSEEVTDIFTRIGEEFKNESGAIAVSSDLSYLENILVKERDNLTEDEQAVLGVYLGDVRDQMKVLETRLGSIKDQFSKVQKGLHQNVDPVLKSRFEEISKIINSSESSAEIISWVTNDLNLIIENMRQCLGCLRKEINNDTNLTFGDSNKFYLMSQSERQKGSISDQIALLVPVTLSGGAKQLSFVLDQVYGSKSSDVLAGHVLAVGKKYRQLKAQFPEISLSVLVTGSALASAGMDVEILERKLKEFSSEHFDFEIFSSGAVNVPKSAGGDHYIEFGGSCRVPGERAVSGVLLT